MSRTALPPRLNSPREVLAFYQTVYEQQVAAGQAFPFLYPLATLPALLILLYLLVDHRRSPFLRWCRFPLFTFILLIETWTIWCNRAIHPAFSFGIGLVSAFGTLWSFGLICCYDCQADFKRLELRVSLKATNDKNQPTEQSLLHWQEYPQTLLHRLDWLTDLFVSFRGVTWTHQISQIPPLPKPILDNLNHGTSTSIALSILSNDNHPNITTTSRAGFKRFTSRRSLLLYSLPRLLISTIVLDIIKTLTSLDPYFWGYTSNTTFSRPIRLTICYIGLYTALYQIFILAPLLFSLLPPSLLPLTNQFTAHPLKTPPAMFGPFSAIFHSGLAGWWSTFWHQTFRLAFTAPSKLLLRRFGVDERSELGKAVGVVMAFSLSGVLHACGSWTQLGDTRPIRGPLAFFVLQAVGIFVERGVWGIIGKGGGVGKRGRWGRGIGNVVFAHLWLYFTAPLLMDDFARGGVWLYEPVPISLLRGLGYGHPDERGWIVWRSLPVSWRTGKHWWDSILKRRHG